MHLIILIVLVVLLLNSLQVQCTGLFGWVLNLLTFIVDKSLFDFADKFKETLSWKFCGVTDSSSQERKKYWYQFF